ncbi:unnamed protein product [Closterium sp. Naga37s-1]|nr:unnamed protein product [Closterium sp. Naga37s-1]
MTDATVPEGHKGLHDFLYGEGDVHEATTSAYTVRPGEDDGTLLSPVPDYVAARELQKLAGIYAVYDGAGALQYVGYSRNIVVSLKGHRAAMGEELCSSVRVQVYRADSMLSRAVLDGERRRWLQELGQGESFMQTSRYAQDGRALLSASPRWLPTLTHSQYLSLLLRLSPSTLKTYSPRFLSSPFSFARWEAQGAQVGAAAAAAAEGGELSDGERAEQEERRLRMRKAMGENLMDDEEYRRRVEGGETDGESDRRRLQLLQATEGDDWSSVIDGQTQETVSARGGSNGKPSRAAKGEARGATATEAATAQQGSGVAAPPAAPPSAAPIVSPFARPGAAGTGAGGEAEEAEGEMELSVESADRVLDRVRPYLVADGGNVEVKAVENGVVILELQGACNTCPSSAATMKMGIERALQDAFGEKLKEVMQLGGVDNRLTLAAVENHLSQVLQPTLSKYGASASAVSLDLVKGFCEVRFEGPPPMAMGIQAALKDKFPEIRLVKLVS